MSSTELLEDDFEDLEKFEDYSETNKRTKEEFARGFIKAYDGALKMVMGKKPRSEKSMDEWLDELDKYVEEERKNGRL